MAIGEICSREVVVVARSESCAQAARLMRENHVAAWSWWRKSERRACRFILEQLKTHRNMSLATVRPDGYPQATTVAYTTTG